MKKYYSLFIIIALLFLLSFKVFNQTVKAKFSMSAHSGCAPLFVSFINESTGPEPLEFFWYLGSEQGVSNLRDPQATYTTPGKYIIKLVVKSGSLKDSIIDSIRVYKNPQANFVANITKGCAPVQIQFNDISVKGDGNIVKWRWDFRGGFIDTTRNPYYTYKDPGSYDVFLKVIDEHGCEGTVEKLGYISIVNPPVANFYYTPTTACKVPANFQFINKSSGGGVISYNWDFGDGTNSDVLSPQKTYENFGEYNVKLTVTSDHGCSSQISKKVFVSQVKANGVLKQSNKEITNGSTVCPNNIVFEANPSGTNFVRWEFGDGIFSSNLTGTISYSIPGQKKVLLIAAPLTECADTIVWNFNIDNVKADFTMSKNFSCMSSEQIQFNDNSTNAVSYLWTFNDGIQSTIKNPSYVYSLPPETDPYKINDSVFFFTKLEVESSNGCKSSITKPFVIKKPTAILKVDKTSGCTPLTVSFKDSSYSDFPITNRIWIFGNNNQQSLSNSNIQYTYTVDGDFWAKLVIINNQNCTDTSYPVLISVGKILNPDFSMSKSNVCNNEIIRFTDNTPQSNLIDEWQYFVNNTPIGNSLNDKNPQWKVNADTGWLNVTLKVNYNGCISQVTKQKVLYNNGPVADFDFVVDCKNPFNYQFINKSKNYNSFKWLFGDGNYNNSLSNPLYTYSSQGDFVVQLITHNGTCHDTISKNIYVRNSKAILNGDTSFCADEEILFSANGSHTYPINYCYEPYVWDFGDGTVVRTFDGNLIHTYKKGGIYTIKLATYYDNGCVDTADLKVHVYQPKALFTKDKVNGCVPLKVVFQDQSIPDYDPIVQWWWNFGGSANLTYYQQRDTVSFNYITSGVYPVRLNVKDLRGCSNTFYDTIYVGNPIANFTVKENSCAGEPLAFYYAHQIIDSAIWDFGDGNIVKSIERPYYHKYELPGEYTIKLKIYQYGCSDSITSATGYVKVQKADAYFLVSDSIANCYPAEINFTHVAGENVVDGKWYFGYGNNYSPYSKIRVFNYNSPGIYTAFLWVKTSFGCLDTFYKNIVVKGPTGNFSMSKEYACRGQDISFQLKDTSGVSNYFWDMGDGTFKYGNPITHSYQLMGEIYPKLILETENKECVVAITKKLNVYVVDAEFSIVDSGLCATYPLKIVNNSKGNDFNVWTIPGYPIIYHKEPEIKFNIPGNYTITLIVKNLFDCYDTLQKQITIYPLPEIKTSNDTLICEGDTIRLFASGGNSIQWFPSIGLDNPNSYVTNAFPTQTTYYVPVVVDEISGCKNKDTVKIFVQNYPRLNIFPLDTTIIIGDVVSMKIDSLPSFVYNWSPDYMINCKNCASPLLQPLENTIYKLNVYDINGCFNVDYYITINVEEKYTIQLPTAFTPNGDGKNDVLYVRGWGIKKLLEFRIYNRWGNEVFYTDDINKGWDGTYKGKMQPVDSYVYFVKAEFWDGTIKTKNGTIILLR